MKKTLTIIIALTVVGVLFYLNQTANAANLALQDSIRADLLAGKVPVLDLSKTSVEEFSQAYIDLAKSSGVDFKKANENKDYNLYRLIRNAEKQKGTAVAAAQEPEVERLNRPKN